MKSVIAAVAMLLLLSLTLMGAKNVGKCEQDRRAKAGNLELRDDISQFTSEANLTC